MGLVVTGDNHRVIAVAEVDRLRIGDRDIIVARSKRQRIDAIAKIDRQTVLGRIEDQRLVAGTADQLDIAGPRTVRIEVLRVDAPTAGTVVILICRLPTNDEAAVGKRGYRGILLAPIRGRVDQELFAGRCAVGVVKLTDNTIVIAIHILRLPGDNKTVAAQVGNRWPQLFAARIGVDLEQATGRHRCIIVRSRHHGELLTEHRPAAVIEARAQLVRPRIRALISPGDDELAVVEAGDRRIMLVTDGPTDIDHELVTNRAARSIKLLAVNVVVAAVAVLIIGFPDLHEAAARQR